MYVMVIATILAAVTGWYFHSEWLKVAALILPLILILSAFSTYRPQYAPRYDPERFLPAMGVISLFVAFAVLMIFFGRW